MASSEHKPIFGTFEAVFAAESIDVGRRRGEALPETRPTVTNELTGLALSGGGIRSAAFSLGVLQALNMRDVIEKLDYLSTVSGGGYIGTAVTIGMSRSKGVFPFGLTGSDPGETPETRHLRDNSRYLLQGGFLGITAACAVYLRGLLTSILTVLPFALGAAALLVCMNPSTFELARVTWDHGGAGIIAPPFPITLIALAALACLWTMYAIVVSVFRVRKLDDRDGLSRAAGVALLVAFVGICLEAHPLLLKQIFQATRDPNLMPATTDNASNDRLAFARALLSTASWLATLSPLAALIMPFLRRLGAQASGEVGGSNKRAVKTVASRIFLTAFAAFLPILLWVGILQLAFWGTAIAHCGDAIAPFTNDCSGDTTHTWTHAPGPIAYLLTGLGAGVSGKFAAAVLYVSTAAAILVTWLFLNVNANSLHQLYRDRLGGAFLVSTKNGAIEIEDDFCFDDIDPKHAPYHLINAALNVPGSSFANQRGRNADFFIFSRRFLGSEATGYVDTPSAQKVLDRFNLGTAMAISGAAAAPNMGMASLRPLSPTIAFLNIRLGRWLPQPADIKKKAGSLPPEEMRTLRETLTTWWWRAPGPWRLLREAFFKSGEDIRAPSAGARADAGFVFLTDGGHIENLGVYELLRRRCRVIIAVDGEADPDLDGASLTQVQRFARIDLGTKIEMDWKPIGIRTRAASTQILDRVVQPTAGPHVALGLIDYPAANDGGQRERGVLVYIKASLTGDENDYVLSYKAKQPTFPNESTMDQLFTEEQFEVYRALGEHATRRFLDGEDAPAVFPNLSSELLTMVAKAFPKAKAGAASGAPKPVSPQI